MVDPIAVLSRIRELGGTSVTLPQVQDEIALIDRMALETTERGRYEVHIWDGVSDLCGMPPEYWRKRGDLPEGGTVYCLHRDGQTLYVQPHDPFQSGFVAMTPTTAQALADAFIARLVEEAVDAEMARQVIMKLVP